MGWKDNHVNENTLVALLITQSLYPKAGREWELELNKDIVEILKSNGKCRWGEKKSKEKNGIKYENITMRTLCCVLSVYNYKYLILKYVVQV